MKIDRFEEIIAWQKAKELTLLIYPIMRNNRDYSFRDQIQRASISIMNNIAEGFERRTNKDMKNFLFIAKGSAGETRSMIDLGYSMKYFSKSEYDLVYGLTMDISKLLSGFIKTL